MAQSKSFSDEFKKNMTSMGLPVPDTLFKTVATTLGTTGALVGAIAKVGASATVAEIFLTGSAAAGGTALAAAAAAAASEVIAVIGAVAASFYIGACIGSVLVAAYETLEIGEIISNIQPWLRKINEALGETTRELLDRVFAQYPALAPVRKALLLGASL